jgi:hypothetical protein
VLARNDLSPEEAEEEENKERASDLCQRNPRREVFACTGVLEESVLRISAVSAEPSLSGRTSTGWICAELLVVTGWGLTGNARDAAGTGPVFLWVLLREGRLLLENLPLFSPGSARP